MTNQAIDADSADFGALIGSSIGSILVAVLTWLAQGLAELALISHALAALHNEPLSVRGGLSRSRTRLWSWLGMTLLKGLAYLGLLLILVVPTALLAIVDENSGAVIGLFCLMLVVVVVLAIVAFYLQTRWLVSSPVLVVEGLGATGSLGRSWRLTRRSFWRCLGVAVVLGLIALVISSLPTVLVQGVLALVTEEMALPTAVGTVLSGLISVLYVPLSAATYLVLYYDLRVRRENLDLDARVQQLEAEVQEDRESSP